MESTVGSESEQRSETTADRRSESRRDDDSARLDRPWRRSDKGDTRSSSTTTRSVDDQDSRRTRKSKKSKASSDKQGSDQTSAADKESEAAPEPPKVALAEAPIPSINVWHQRKEQQTKVKPHVAEVVSAAMAPQDDAATTAASSVKDATATTDAPKENKTANGVKPNRKVGDSTRPERNGTRGNRAADKDAKIEIPPPVQDATLWPTPEIAIKEDKKKPASDKQQQTVVHDAKEQVQDDSQGKPRHKEKWVAYDYVPTVNFETQLPQMRNSKPRGGARSGGNTRTSTGSQASDKPSTNTQSAKPYEAKERSRENAASSTNRNTSQPPSSKRTSVDASAGIVKEQKKAANQQADKSKDAAPALSSVSRSTKHRIFFSCHIVIKKDMLT